MIGVTEPALVITADEIEDAARPLEVAYGDKTLSFTNPNGMPLDEVEAVVEELKESPVGGMQAAAHDDETRDVIPGLPFAVVMRIGRMWDDRLDLSLGESGGSEASSEPTGQ